MEIYINQQVFEGKLENEKTAGDVYTGILNWVEGNQKYLLGCQVDGIEMDKKDMDGIALETVQRLDFTIGEEADLLQTSLVELDHYIDTVGNTLFGRDSLTSTEAKDLQEGVEWMTNMLELSRNMLHLDLTKIKPLGKGRTVDEILPAIQAGAASIDSAEQIEAFLESLRDLKLFVMDLVARTSALLLSDEELRDLLKDSVASIEDLKNSFARVNEFYQSGKDSEATELLAETSGKLNLMLTAIISLNGRNKSVNYETVEIGGENFQDKLNLLNDTFARVALALEENDIVTAGDILEYELPEVLDEVIPYLQKINSILQQGSL